MPITSSRIALAGVALCVACAGHSRQSLYPIPDRPATGSDIRGTEQSAREISDDQQIRIISEVVRDFYRPSFGQARWIDPRPLAHRRSPAADSLSRVEDDWAEAIVGAVALQRVCARESDAACHGRPGGVLRFSRPYAAGTDTAVVFARYTPTQRGPAGEMEFLMIRRNGSWDIASKRTVAVGAPHGDARQLADELLEADRGFAAASARTDVVSALSAMFDADVIMPIPGAFAEGKARAVEFLRGTPENIGARLEWAPVRAGVSGDGQQGFTFGYMTLHKADSSRVAMKYMSYWIKRPDGWRAIGYKRRVRAAGDIEVASMAPSLPEQLQPPTGDAAIIARHRASLAAAEKEFSDTAQVMGIGPAFVKYGLPDAVNMGGPNAPAFIVGSPAIGKSVGAGYPPTGSPVSWTADHKVIVASSGDLGVTFGFIRSNNGPGNGFPFFTIWKRASPNGPWRYIAE
jgi:ketosteroid isomerase-like protein